MADYLNLLGVFFLLQQAEIHALTIIHYIPAPSYLVYIASFLGLLFCNTIGRGFGLMVTVNLNPSCPEINQCQ